MIRELIDIQYTRNDIDVERGSFRVRGDVLEIYPAQGGDYLIRVEYFGDEIDRITEVDPLTGKVHASLNHIGIFPASHYVVSKDKIMSACDIYAHPSIREGLGLASLEAMASGLPLITSNVQGVPDYVENGVTGYMCAPMDVDGYAENLHKLTSDKSLRKNIGKTNVTYVQKYRVEVIEPVIKEILNECYTPEKETVKV